MFLSLPTNCQTAIAAAVDLRCYGLLSTTITRQGKEPTISLICPDVGYTNSWSIASLPYSSSTVDHPTDSLDASLMNSLTSLVTEGTNLSDARASSAAIAFLYLYIKLSALSASESSTESLTFTARSALPISAGLGSSASYAVCISTALLLHTSLLALPVIPANSTPSHLHITHHGRKLIKLESAALVNTWAFLAEKVIHGNPSGIDNAVAVHGGALSYVRPNLNPLNLAGGMQGLHGFKSIRFLLIDSKVPRNTKELVEGVGKRMRETPVKIGAVMDGIERISQEVERCLMDSEMNREILIGALEVSHSPPLPDLIAF